MKISVRIIFFALCFGFFVFVNQMPAAEIEGVTFKNNIITENEEFQLRGVALQRYLLVRHERTFKYIKVRVTAQKMRVGPSESACRSRLQTTSSCIGKEPLW